LSWIIHELWQSLDERREEYEVFLREGKFEGFAAINRIASGVAAKWGIMIQVNFPPGQEIVPGKVGRRDLSILVHKERRRFEGVSTEQLNEAFRKLAPVSVDNTGYGYEGYKIRLPKGRIDCLPGGVHIWCEITPEVSNFLDWLFTEAFGLKPEAD
jgi:hypothetical protein